MEEKVAGNSNLKKLKEDFERIKVSKANLRVENQQLFEVSVVLYSCILFLLYLGKCNIYLVPLVMT